MPLPQSLLRAGCKINLFLKVGPRLENGYHTLETLFFPLPEPYDEISIRPLAPSDGASGGILTEFIAVSPHGEDAPLPDINPQSNTLTKAHVLFAELTGFSPALHVTVRKGIPHGAGLGGGSSDAAALLRWLHAEALAQKKYSPLPFERLTEESARVGADVPFFLKNTASFAGGIGEKLLPVNISCNGESFLLVCPPLHVSTAWAFAALDEYRAKETSAAAGGTPSTEKYIETEQKNVAGSLTSSGLHARSSLARFLDEGNDFEHVVFTAHPELALIREHLMALGAQGARMSGTGSALFALFRDEKIAKNAAKELANGGVTVYMHRVPENETGIHHAGV